MIVAHLSEKTDLGNCMEKNKISNSADYQR
jgi:hypothetical protein